MPAAIALGTPYLGDVEGEPVIVCDYAILPTGSMLQADQLMYGQIMAPAVISQDQPVRMVASATQVNEIFPRESGDVDRLEELALELNEYFNSYLSRLNMIEDLITEE